MENRQPTSVPTRPTALDVCKADAAISPHAAVVGSQRSWHRRPNSTGQPKLPGGMQLGQQRLASEVLSLDSSRRMVMGTIANFNA